MLISWRHLFAFDGDVKKFQLGETFVIIPATSPHYGPG